MEKLRNREFILLFIPRREVFIVGILFYILGIITEIFFMDFNYGFLTGNMEVHFSAFPGFKLQFIDYLGFSAAEIFISNMKLIIIFIFTAATLIPVLKLFMLSGGLLFKLVTSYGFKGILIYIGTLHIHIEFLACLLALQAFFIFYTSIIRSLKLRSKHTLLKTLKSTITPILIIITLLFALAALVEVFWSTWWVYILSHRYVPWGYFYTHVYDVNF